MPSLFRRALALGLPRGTFALGALSLAGHTGHAAAAGAAAATPQAQIRIGRFTVTALADGYADMPYTFFPGRTAGQVEQAARAQFVARAGGVRFLFNQYLIEDGGRRVLIDAGPAGSLGQSGMLPQALAAAGLRPDQIDAVIVTHMHQDHIGGLVAGGRNSFPNAEVYVDRRDLVHWTDAAKQNAAPDYLQPSFSLSADVLRLYPRLQAIDGERQIARGISIVDLAGHTPGHIGVRIEDAGQSLVMVSDMVFPVVHPAATDVNFIMEQDHAAAKAMRDRFFPRAAEDGALIAATHMAFPGLGRIVPDGGSHRWQPADWAFQA
jgi:glyoxylase-like metal-dependent hydrolase (beta-lactamase superfamily II)